jgi:hypothetical protein
MLGKKQHEAQPTDDAAGEPAKPAWAWSIIPYLTGEQPDLEQRVAKLAAWERFLPGPMAPGLAHHRYTLFVPAAR